MIRMGIDVGGTNTDGVILNSENEILSSTKSPTTKDIFSGINDTISTLINDSEIDPDKINVASLGTTHCTNAILERKNLNRVGIIRICLPSGSTIPPMLDWPEALKKELKPISIMIQGGYEYDGSPIAKLNEEELKLAIEKFRGEVESIAVTSVFSPVQNEQEIMVARYLNKYLPDIPVSLSNEIGSIGLIERENATILNAALMTTINNVTNGFEMALNSHKIKNAKIFLGQNDGTLMNHNYVKKYPIYTIACGPTNSIRGASHLSNEPNAIVVDIGGTTTDIGVLQNSFPRHSSLAIDVGGVRTNYRTPDIYSTAFGGGTSIKYENMLWKIGPESVGHRLKEKSLAFGGDTLTTTDIAISLKQMNIESAKKNLPSNIPAEEIYSQMIKILEDAIDRIKTSHEDTIVILVGGGASLVPGSLNGASNVIKPEHADVANAIGAALGDVSGTIEKVYSLEEDDYDTIIKKAKNEAIGKAVESGADPNEIKTIQIEDFPLPYLPGNALQVNVKVAGPLKI